MLSFPVGLLWISKTITNDHITDRSLCTSESPFNPLDRSQVFYVCRSHEHLPRNIRGRRRDPRHLGTSQGVPKMVADCSRQGVPRGDAVEEPRA